MPDRAKALFPDYHPAAFEAAVAAMGKEVKRISGRVRGPKDCQLAFNELVRPRESTLRYGEVKTLLSDDAQNVAEELFRRYFRGEPAEGEGLKTLIVRRGFAEHFLIPRRTM